MKGVKVHGHLTGQVKNKKTITFTFVCRSFGYRTSSGFRHIKRGINRLDFLTYFFVIVCVERAAEKNGYETGYIAHDHSFE